MSRIGKQPVAIPSGITITIQDNVVTVKGPKGELHKKIDAKIGVEQKENEIIVSRKEDTKVGRSLHGLARNLIRNMVEGVTKGFEKKLEIIGVGYRANPTGNRISLTLGYSHPIEFQAPQGIEFKMDEELKNVIVVRGIDKEMVGEVAAKIRSYRKPEPYKGKGIRYLGEYVPRKAGKSAGAKAAA